MVMPGGFTEPTVYQPIPFIVPGPLATFVGTVRLPFDGNYTILGVRATLGTPSVGAPLIADVLVNGTSIFTTTANRPTVPAGINASTVTVPDEVSFTENSYITIAVLQVGSTVAGSDLCVLVSTQRTS